jgi:hypothetical protein
MRQREMRRRLTSQENDTIWEEIRMEAGEGVMGQKDSFSRDEESARVRAIRVALCVLRLQLTT